MLAVVDPGVRISFGDSGGAQAFKTQVIDKPTENFWGEFGAILRLGGRFRTNDAFDAPYTFSAWPENLDSFECLAITGSRVRVRAAAGTRRANRDATRLRDRARQSRKSGHSGMERHSAAGWADGIRFVTVRAKPDRSSSPVPVSRRALVADGLRRRRLKSVRAQHGHRIDSNGSTRRNQRGDRRHPKQRDARHDKRQKISRPHAVQHRLERAAQHECGEADPR